MTHSSDWQKDRIQSMLRAKYLVSVYDAADET